MWSILLEKYNIYPEIYVIYMYRYLVPTHVTWCGSFFLNHDKLYFHVVFLCLGPIGKHLYWYLTPAEWPYSRHFVCLQDLDALPERKHKLQKPYKLLHMYTIKCDFYAPKIQDQRKGGGGDCFFVSFGGGGGGGGGGGWWESVSRLIYCTRYGEK